jgi:flagellar hook protein FlgE
MSISGAMNIGVAGLNAFGSAMTVLSDNVANANTTGFKSSHVRFGDLVSSYYVTQSTDTDRQGSGSTILGISTDFSEGPIQTTSAWSDVAINGEGFLNVRLLDATGAATGATYYTRDGSLHMDRNGYLVNSQGYGVLDSGGAPIRVEAAPSTPVYTNYNIDANGQVWGSPIAGGNAVAIGAPMRMTTFPNQDGLLRHGNNLYQLGPQAGTQVDSVANTASTGSITSRAIETSNVDIANEMVTMIVYQADFNANSKSITVGDNMLTTVVNLIR